MGELERAVMEQLWSAGDWVTVRAVHEALAADRDVAYTTVMTTLTRLHEKGMLTRERSGRAYAYSLVDTASVTAHQMRQVLDSGADRKVVLARFLDELRPDERPVLTRLLRDAGRKQS